jgi:hypothetical protein
MAFNACGEPFPCQWPDDDSADSRGWLLSLMRAVFLSSDAVTMRDPSGLKVAEVRCRQAD